MRVLKVVVASPSDVESESSRVAGIAHQVNRDLRKAGFDLEFQVFYWRTDAHPGFHADGPQGLVDSLSRIEDSDLLIGIFWKRFGTPVADAGSGTEHEIRRAYDSWRSRGAPQIMVYFKESPYAPQSKEETDQWGKVLEFKGNFPEKGLWWPYRTQPKFEQLVRVHLWDHACELIHREHMAVQPDLSCFATCVPRIVRSEGLSEPMADIVLVCMEGSVPNGGAIRKFDVRVALNVNMTNPRKGNVTDALLLPNDGAAGPGGGPAVPGPIQGLQSGNAGLLFTDVPIAPLAGRSQSIRITNVRANAWQVGPESIRAFVSAAPSSPGGAALAIANAVLVVSTPRKGFGFRVRSVNDGAGAPVTFERSEGVNADAVDDPARAPLAVGFNLQFREQLRNGFRTSDAEAGRGAVWPGALTGSASNGTRFLVRFYDVPSNVQIFVSARDATPGAERAPFAGPLLKAVLVQRSDANGAGGDVPFFPTVPAGVGMTTGGLPVAQLKITNGFAFAVWEWVGASRGADADLEEVSFGVVVAAKAGEAGLGTATVSGSVAPLSSVSTSSDTAPIPRFVDVATPIEAFRFTP